MIWSFNFTAPASINLRSRHAADFFFFFFIVSASLNKRSGCKGSRGVEGQVYVAPSDENYNVNSKQGVAAVARQQASEPEAERERAPVITRVVFVKHIEKTNQ